MLSTSGPALTWLVDHHNLLVDADRNWFDFYEQNTSSRSRKSLLGINVLNIIHGDDVRSLYSTIFNRVRQTQQPIDFSFRCDSPTDKRLFRMQIRPQPAHKLLFESFLIRSEPHPDCTELPLALQRSRWLKVCSWCSRVHLQTWVELPLALDRLELLVHRHCPRLTHGVCPDCRGRLLNS